MKHTPIAILTTLSVLAILWLTLSGHFGALMLVLGALSCGAVTWLTLHLKLLPEDGSRLAMIPRMPAYFAWLIHEIIVANFQVAQIILSRHPKLERCIVHTRAQQRTAFGVAMYANSITLTPGTITIDAEGEELSVHVLALQCADDVLGNEMNERVARMEGDA